MSNQMSGNDYRVLSIQSHVVSGYVGNKSVVFPLQTIYELTKVLGLEVDAINSVQFGTHTGYKHWSGQVLNANDLNTLFDNLVQNDLHKRYTHILTGYVGNESFLETVCQVIQTVKSVNPDALYICDPVMGDHGKLYVPKELIPIYRNKIIPMADVITPNQFEIELLTDIKIKTETDAMKALEALHAIGIPTVVITSSSLADNDHQMITIASSRAGGRLQRCKLVFRKIEATFTGSGDLFAALFIAWFTKTNKDLKTSCEKTLSSLFKVLERTYDYAVQQPGGVAVPANIELRLIQSRADLENPEIIIQAIDI